MSQAKLDRLFEFLKTNKKWNKGFQTREYRRNLCHCDSERSRLTTLLRMSANTQAKPNLNHLSKFWENLHKANQRNFTTCEAFTRYLELTTGSKEEGKEKWDRLFNALCKQSGWGGKTAALFIKHVIKIHKDTPEHGFWNDARDRTVSHKDRIYLPVDSVIKFIFLEAGLHSSGSAFNGINQILSGYKPEEILIWDDLWFWGFFTQKTEADSRVIRWNPEKFWCQQSSDFDRIVQIKELGDEFTSIIYSA